MPVKLFDVNLLLALAWPNHAHHQLATQWFDNNAESGWATCPMTECGFIRISSNSKFIAEAVLPHQAVQMLNEMVAHPFHHFWADDIPANDPNLVTWSTVQGHRQITDAYLFGLCRRHGGRLATLDQGILSFQGHERGLDVVELIA